MAFSFRIAEPRKLDPAGGRFVFLVLPITSRECALLSDTPSLRHLSLCLSLGFAQSSRSFAFLCAKLENEYTFMDRCLSCCEEQCHCTITFCTYLLRVLLCFYARLPRFLVLLRTV